MAQTGKNDELLLKRGQTVLFDGDSLTSRRLPGTLDTWPFLHLMNWHTTYADEVQKLVFCLRPELRLRFRNAAIGGSSSRDLVEKFDRMVLPWKPDWVILTICGNDVARGIRPAEFRRNMTAYCERVRDECGGRVVFVGGWRACPGVPEAKAASYRRRAPYFRIQRELAAAYDGLYVDAGKALQAKARQLYSQSPYHVVYSDGGHFNAVGNLIIAAEVLRALGFGL